MKTAGTGTDITFQIDTNTATAGKVMKVIDDNGVLKPSWEVDAASGFNQWEVPFGASDSTLTSDSGFYMEIDNFSKKIVMEDTNSDGQRSFVEIRPMANYSISNNSIIVASTTNVNTNDSVPNIIESNGDWGALSGASSVLQLSTIKSNTAAGQNLAAVNGQILGAIQFNAKDTDVSDLNNHLFQHGIEIIGYTDGDWAANDHPSKLSFLIAGAGQNVEENEVMTIDSDGLTLKHYGNSVDSSSTVPVKNLLYSNNDGKIQSLGLGTDGQILKVVDNAGTLELQWATDTSNLSFGSGLTEDNGAVRLDGVLTQNATIATQSGNTFSVTGSGATFTHAYDTVQMQSTVTNDRTTASATGGNFTIASTDTGTNEGFTFNFSPTQAVFNDTHATKIGIEYGFTDYTNLTDNSLITKKYADDLVSGAQSPLTFLNGLTKTGDDVTLGGALTGATTLTLANNDFNFASGGTGRVKSAADIEFTDAAAGVILMSPNGTKFRVVIDNDGILDVSDPIT